MHFQAIGKGKRVTCAHTHDYLQSWGEGKRGGGVTSSLEDQKNVYVAKEKFEQLGNPSYILTEERKPTA